MGKNGQTDGEKWANRQMGGKWTDEQKEKMSKQTNGGQNG